MTVQKRQNSYPLFTFPVNSYFRVSVCPEIKGQLLNNQFDSKVRIVRGAKYEVTWWAASTMVESISKEEYENSTKIVEKPNANDIKQERLRTNEYSVVLRKKRQRIFDKPVTAIIRWLAWKKITKDKIKKILVSYSAEAKDSTIECCMYEGSREDEKFGKRAVLTAEEEKILFTLCEK